MTIGKLSRATGCNIETIRYYEKVAILGKPARTAGGHRAYSDGDRQRLAFILRSRQLGFSLSDVRELLILADEEGSCEVVRDVTLRHLDKVRSKINDLASLAATLEATAAQCEGSDAPACPILDALSGKRPA